MKIYDLNTISIIFVITSFEVCYYYYYYYYYFFFLWEHGFEFTTQNL
ncbi:hypothetical protein ACMBCM_09690 [Spiroplasma sp. K1]